MADLVPQEDLPSNPDSNLVPDSDAPNLVPEADLPQEQSDQDKYGTPSQQAITALEGAAEGVAGPVAPWAEEKLGLSSMEDIKGRHEANPIIHGAGEAAGFAGSMLVGVGEGALIGKAGEVALKATKLAELGKDASTAAKLARGAVKLSTEMGLLGASDEATRAIENGAEAPGDVISNMKLSNILTSAALGAAAGPVFEGASSLLKRTVDLPFLQQFTDRLALRKGMEDELDTLHESFQKPKGLAEKLADAWYERFTPEHVGNALAETVGAAAERTMGGGMSSDIGGAYVGKQVLGPVFRSVLKPLMEAYPNIDLNAFKAATGFAQKTIEGNNLLNKGAKAVLSGGETLPSSYMSSRKELEELDEHAATLGSNLNDQASPGNEIGAYAPQHAAVLSKNITSAVDYINNARPKPTQTGMMNTPIPPSPSDMARYYQKLAIVQQPLAVLPKIKDGTLLPSDVAILKTIYPEYHAKISRQLMQEIVQAQHDGKLVPYKTKQALSLFLGQNMTNSLDPMSIQAAQPMPRQPANQPAGTGKAKKKQSLDKAPGMYKTADQSAEADRSTRE